MTKLRDDSLVKRFGKQSTVIVDICGDKKRSATHNKEKAAAVQKETKADIMQEMLVQQREAAMER